MAITIVQHRSSTAAGTSLALAFASNNTANNLLLYASAGNVNSSQITTDNNTNTIANVNTTTASGGDQRIDDVVQCKSGANTATANSSAATRIHFHIWEISGCTATPLDQSNTGSQAATAQSISTSGATTVANELVFGQFYDEITNDSLTAGSGFSPSEFTDGGTGNETMLTEVKIVSSTGVQTATATCGSGTNNVGQAIATFKGTASSNVVFEDDHFLHTTFGRLPIMDIPTTISVWG